MQKQLVVTVKDALEQLQVLPCLLLLPLRPQLMYALILHSGAGSPKALVSTLGCAATKVHTS